MRVLAAAIAAVLSTGCGSGDSNIPGAGMPKAGGPAAAGGTTAETGGQAVAKDPVQAPPRPPPVTKFDSPIVPDLSAMQPAPSPITPPVVTGRAPNGKTVRGSSAR